MTKARKHYDGGYIPPVFSNVSTPKKIGLQSPNRQSGRFHSKSVCEISVQPYFNTKG